MSIREACRWLTLLLLMRGNVVTADRIPPCRKINMTNVRSVDDITSKPPQNEKKRFQVCNRETVMVINIYRR